MFLTGQLDKDDRKLVARLETIAKDVLNQSTNLKPERKAKALHDVIHLMWANFYAIYVLCQDAKMYGSPVVALMRSLLEASISALAFCKNPTDSARLCEEFGALLEWKFAVKDSPHIGTYFVPDTIEQRKRLRERMVESETNLRAFAQDLMKKRNPTLEDVEKAIQGTTLKRFRDTWYPNERKSVLETHRLEWMYDVLYVRYSSCVHSDSAAHNILRSIDRSAIVVSSSCIVEIGLHQIAETFAMKLTSTQTQSLKHTWEEFTRRDHQ